MCKENILKKFTEKLLYFGMKNFKFRTFILSWPPESARQMVAPGGALRFEAVDFIKIHQKIKISSRLSLEQTKMKNPYFL